MSVSTSPHRGFPIPGVTIMDRRLDDMRAIKAALLAIDVDVANAISATQQTVVMSAITGDIIPVSNSLQSIGSTTNRFKAIYVDEAHLSVNTLYLGDTPVLGTNANTVNIKADPNQSITMTTTGTGATNVTSERSVLIATSGVNSDVLVQTSGIGSEVRMGSAVAVNLAAPITNVTGNLATVGNQSVGGTLTVTGDLVVNGSNFIVNSTTVTTKDNIIVVNKGQIGAGVSAGIAGLSIDRGDSPAYQMVFDESDDMFKVGTTGALQTIASQTYVSTYSAPVAHTHAVATTSVSGLMAAADKVKLDNLAATTIEALGGVASSALGVASGVATLDATGKLSTAQIPVITLPFNNITTKPTTLAGYGITDAASIVLPQNIQSNAYTTTLNDAGGHILHPSADTTARTITIPANTVVAYLPGTALTFVNQNAAGVITIAINTDTMRLAGAGTVGSRTLAANGVATALKISATEWIISGTNLT